MRVVDDCYISANQVEYTFCDNSTVVVQEHTNGVPPYCTKVSGDFTPEKCAAITAYSRLQVK